MVKINIEDSKLKKNYMRMLSQIEREIRLCVREIKPKSLKTPCMYPLESGGKRVRPMLVLLSGAVVHGEDTKKLYNAAIALELLHSVSLTHDDIMDNSGTRRGRNAQHLEYGIGTTVLAGDALFFLAYANLLKDAPEKQLDSINIFTKGGLLLCEGQALDKELAEQANIESRQYKIMIYKKSASLIELSCKLGATLSGGSREEIKSLSMYGRYLGMAFQIQDDLLDVISEKSVTGKTHGSDLLEGKKTFLLLRALEKSHGKERQHLLNLIKNNGTKKSALRGYIALYRRLGVLTDAQKEVSKYTSLAIRQLSNLAESEHKNLLVELALALTRRTN